MVQSSEGPFDIDVALVRESLNALAILINAIAHGGADDPHKPTWGLRSEAAGHVRRLRLLLSGGRLEGARHDLRTLATLREVWELLKMLCYGGGQSDYRGPLFLPGETDDEGSFIPRGEGRLDFGWFAIVEGLRELSTRLERNDGDGHSHGTAIKRPATAHDAPTPLWDSDTGQLLFRGRIVRRYGGQATNVRAVLTAFQEQDWRPRIDDPLSGGRNPQRLNETVKSLNQGLTVLRFRADGTGAGFLWEPVTGD